MLQAEKVAAIVVAGGASRRMGFDKMLARLENGRAVIEQSVLAFSQHPMVDEIVVVASSANLPQIQSMLAGQPKVTAIVPGGAERFDSVRAGLEHTQARWLAIHDGARPFVSAQVITQALLGALQTGCAAPAVPVKDTIKVAVNGVVQSTPERSALYAVQTPQVVERERYRQAMLQAPPAVTDDCMVMEHAGYEVRLTQGDYANRKVTTPEDLLTTKQTNTARQLPCVRVGHGYDVHRLAPGRALVLGGCTVPFEKGLLGHSDADVLTHAVMDALLGAAALGDIGQHFPDNDPAYAGADSVALLRQVVGLLKREGLCVGNIDATILCQRPKLAPYIPQMRAALALALGVQPQQVSVKATTEEKLGFTGAGEGIAAHCVALLTKEE